MKCISTCSILQITALLLFPISGKLHHSQSQGCISMYKTKPYSQSPSNSHSEALCKGCLQLCVSFAHTILPLAQQQVEHCTKEVTAISRLHSSSPHLHMQLEQLCILIEVSVQCCSLSWCVWEGEQLWELCWGIPARPGAMQNSTVPMGEGESLLRGLLLAEPPEGSPVWQGCVSADSARAIHVLPLGTPRTCSPQQLPQRHAHRTDFSLAMGELGKGSCLSNIKYGIGILFPCCQCLKCYQFLLEWNNPKSRSSSFSRSLLSIVFLQVEIIFRVFYISKIAWLMGI